MEKVKVNNLIKILAVSFIIVICPAASWYYLQKGLDYQKEARKEIVVKETIDVAQFIPKHILEDPGLLENKLRLLFFNDKKKNGEERKQLIAKLIEQFEDSKGVLLIEIVRASNSENLSNAKVGEMHIQKELNPVAYDALLSTQVGQPNFESIEGKIILESIVKNEPLKNDLPSYAMLVDHKGGIRTFYDVDDPSRIKRLIEHMAILIPRVNTEKAELIRDKEI